MGVNVNMADDQMLIKYKLLYIKRYNHEGKNLYELCTVEMRLEQNNEQ